MPTQTTNYNLIKPSEDDFYNIDDFNSNTDKIDKELFELHSNKNTQLIKNVPPTQNDDSTKGILVGDTWMVPDITFHNLVKNATSLKASDWAGTYCNVSEFLSGIELLENGSGEKYACAKQNTGQNIKAGHKYYLAFTSTSNPSSYVPNYTTLKVLVGERRLGDPYVNNVITENGISETKLISSVFTAPDDITGEISIAIGFGNTSTPLNGHRVSVQYLHLIDLTEDMREDLEFSKEQADSCFKVDFSDELFQVKTYKYSGSYQCLNNVENKAMWQRADIPRVGQPYFSLNPTSPAEIYGGTWEKIEERMLLGANYKYPVGSTGGSTTVKLSQDNLPGRTMVRTTIKNAANSTDYTAINNGWRNICLFDAKAANASDFTYEKPLNILPPYIAIHIWKRIA